MSDYRIFSTKYDQTVSARELLNKKLDAMSDLPGDAERWLDSVEKHMERANTAVTVGDIGPGRPITILLEMGGSMRGAPILTAVSAIEALGDALEAEGRSFSVLGYTTSQWKGGLSRKDWNDAGRPRLPGRLNDLLHITFKSFEEDWSQCRADLKLAFINGILKENIDGEAVLWARQAQVKAGVEGSIVHISDGPSMDDSTLSVNLLGFLDNHRREVISDLADKGIQYRSVNINPIVNDLSLMKMNPESSRTAALVQMLRTSIKEMDAEINEAPSPG